MISIVFDPDAKAEFLAAVQYYESCQSGLGRRFKLIVQPALQIIHCLNIRVLFNVV